MENTLTEFSLAVNSEKVKEVEDHQPVVLFTKENTDADKPVPVINLPPVRFICEPKRQVRKVSIQGS